MAKIHDIDNGLAVILPEEEKKNNEAVRTVKKSKRRAFAFNPIQAAAWVLLIACALLLIAMYIRGRVEISQLYNERGRLEDKLALMENENVSMKSEIAERMNVTKVEEYAKNSLGLQKLARSQIEYIEVDTPSVAEVKQDVDEDIFVRMKHWVDSAKEYLGI